MNTPSLHNMAASLKLRDKAETHIPSASLTLTLAQRASTKHGSIVAERHTDPYHSKREPQSSERLSWNGCCRSSIPEPSAGGSALTGLGSWTQPGVEHIAGRRGREEDRSLLWEVWSWCHLKHKRSSGMCRKLHFEDYLIIILCPTKMNFHPLHLYQISLHIAPAKRDQIGTPGSVKR